MAKKIQLSCLYHNQEVPDGCLIGRRLLDQEEQSDKVENERDYEDDVKIHESLSFAGSGKEDRHRMQCEKG